MSSIPHIPALRHGTRGGAAVLGRDAAMLVYHAAQEFACGDKRIPNVGWVTSVYQRRDGRWQNVLFEHMPVPPPKPPASKQP